MKLKVILTTLLTIAAALVAPIAAAHTGVHLTGGLVDGFMHPVSGLDHLIVAIGAGFWAARSGDHGIRDMLYFLLLFAGGMLLGVVSQAWSQPDVTTPLMFLLIVAVIAVAISYTPYFMHAFFGSFAVYHGVAHMLEMPANAALTGFVIGLLVSTAVLLTLGLMLRQVVATRRRHDMRTH
jgi:urease accessory protein